MSINPVRRLLLLSIVASMCLSTLAASTQAPEIEDLANATYLGFQGVDGAITLNGGKWQGEPWLEGGVSAPSAQLVGELLVQGDPDNDGHMESVNLVNYSTGGTGQLLHLTVSRFGNSGLENVATAFLGDRVMVRGLRIENDTILADLVQAGPNDGACCPGDVVTRRWHLRGDQLQELPVSAEPERLSVKILEGGGEWVLKRWEYNEPVEEGTTITLEYQDGRFSGRSVCNRYFAGVKAAGDVAGGIEVSGVAGTRMACTEAQLAVLEGRYFDALQGVKRVSFMAGELVLTWQKDSAFGSLYFSQNPPVK